MESPVLKNSSIFNFKRLPIALILTVISIIGIETVLSSFEDYMYSLHYDGLRMKVKNDFSQFYSESDDILILGDCYNLIGVIPDTIEKKTHLKCFNLSHHRVQTVAASYLLLENYLKTRDRKPSYIIMGYSHLSIADETPDLRYLYDFSRGNRIAFAREFGLVHMCKSLFISIRKQGFFKKAISHPYSVFNSGLVDKNDFINQVIYQDKGYYAWYADRVYTGWECPGWEDEDFKKFHISSFFKRYFEKINRLAMENNIKVIYVIPVLAPTIWNSFYNEAYEDYYEYFKSFQENKNPNLLILNPQSHLNENLLFSDCGHLNRKGAGELSNYLADVINIDDSRQDISKLKSSCRD
jgi:hypothetical protein